MSGERLAVAVDVGGTLVKGALVRRDGTAVRSEQRPTGATSGVAAVVDGLARFAADLAREAEELTGHPPVAAGAVVPGIVDEAAGIAVFSANLGWQDLPLREQLAARLGLPVVLGHDVRAGGLAELRLGAARGRREVLFVAVGTGIAGAVVVDGRPYAGARGQAGEIGHVVVDREDGAACGCGGRGCLETVASAAAIARRYGARVGAGGVEAAEVVRRAGAGDPIAREVVGRATAALADVLAAYSAVLDPELIVLGGGLFRAGAALLGSVEEAMTRGRTFLELPVLTLAALGDQAGCLGAGLMAWEHQS